MGAGSGFFANQALYVSSSKAELLPTRPVYPLPKSRRIDMAAPIKQKGPAYAEPHVSSLIRYFTATRP